MHCSFLEDEGEALEMLVHQLAACDRRTLSAASLSVDLTDEPGAFLAFRLCVSVRSSSVCAAVLGMRLDK